MRSPICQGMRSKLHWAPSQIVLLRPQQETDTDQFFWYPLLREWVRTEVRFRGPLLPVEYPMYGNERIVWGYVWSCCRWCNGFLSYWLSGRFQMFDVDPQDRIWNSVLNFGTIAVGMHYIYMYFEVPLK